MKKDLAVLIFLVLAGVVGVMFYRVYTHSANLAPTPGGDDRNPVVSETGQVTLRVGQKGTVGNVTIMPLAIVEDSRCPIGVTCIWAGTVKVKTGIQSGLGTSENTIELGKSITTEAEEITFVSVEPTVKEGQSVAESAYRFTYNVALRSLSDINPGVPTGKCYVGGCSAQICSDEEGVASTCEYRESYACYRTAKCERQANGQCGWTQTPALTMCLQNAEAI